MSYVLKFDPTAEAQLSAQPQPLRSFIEAALSRLAKSPSSVRTRSITVPHGQIAEFRYDDQPGVTIWVTVRFQYGADEQTLHIEKIVTEFGS